MENNVVLQVGVKILLKNKEGEYLLVRRNSKKYPEVGPKWDIVGGRINPGSPLLENLKREIFEETKLTLEKEPRLIAVQDILKLPEKHIVRITYLGEIDGNPEIDEESSEFSWFTIDELKKINKEDLDRYFNELLENNSFSI